MGDKYQRIEQMAAEGRISPEDAKVVHEALEAAERRGAARGGAILKGSAIFSGIMLALDVAVCLWLAAMLPPTLDFFTSHFRELGIYVPTVSRVLFSMPGWSYALGFLVLSAALLIKEIPIKNKVATLTANTAVFVGLLVFTMFAVWAVFEPIRYISRIIFKPK